MPLYNNWQMTLTCLQSLVESAPETSYEVIPVNNGSTDQTAELLTNLGGDVRPVTLEENDGFGGGCNAGARVAQGEFICFLSNDVKVLPGWLDPLVKAFDEDPELAAVTPRLLFPDGSLNDAGGLIFAKGDAWNYGKHHPSPRAAPFRSRRYPDYACGACLVVRRSCFEAVGGFDDRYKPSYYEDVDLAFEFRARGWKVMYEPAADVIHVEGATNGTDVTSGTKRFQVINQEKFAAKWADELAWRPAVDPAIVEAWAHRDPKTDPKPLPAND